MAKSIQYYCSDSEQYKPGHILLLLKNYYYQII